MVYRYLTTPGSRLRQIYHLHFLTKDRKAGGHVLDCALENLTVQVDPIHKFNLVLPGDQEFYRLNLEKDQSVDLKKVEK